MPKKKLFGGLFSCLNSTEEGNSSDRDYIFSKNIKPKGFKSENSGICGEQQASIVTNPTTFQSIDVEQLRKVRDKLKTSPEKLNTPKKNENLLLSELKEKMELRKHSIEQNGLAEKLITGKGNKNNYELEETDYIKNARRNLKKIPRQPTTSKENKQPSELEKKFSELRNGEKDSPAMKEELNIECRVTSIIITNEHPTPQTFEKGTNKTRNIGGSNSAFFQPEGAAKQPGDGFVPTIPASVTMGKGT